MPEIGAAKHSRLLVSPEHRVEVEDVSKVGQVLRTQALFEELRDGRHHHSLTKLATPPLDQASICYVLGSIQLP